MAAPLAPPSADLIALLDIGSRAISCALCHPADARIIATATGPSAGIQAGAIREPRDAYGAIVRVIAEAERMAGLQARSALVAVTGGFIRIERLTGDLALDPPIVTAEATQRLTSALVSHAAPPGRMIVHKDFVEARLDGRTYAAPPIDRFGRNLELALAITTIDSAPVRRLLETIEATDLPIAGIVPAGLAMSLAVTTAAERRDGVAVIDVGHEQSTIATWYDGRLTSLTSIAQGIRHIARDLATRLSIPTEKAERIIEQYGIDGLAHAGVDDGNRRQVSGLVIDQAAPASGAADAWETNPDRRLVSLLGLVADRFDAPEAQLPAASPVVLTGGGSRVAGLAKRASYIWARTVQTGAVVGNSSLDSESAVLTGMARALAMPSIGVRYDLRESRRQARVA